MRSFVLGILVGSLLTTVTVGAGSGYDKAGEPNAPRGSIQQYDYHRQRQQYLDLNALRRNQEEAIHHGKGNPCAR